MRPVVQVQAEEMDRGADQLDGGWDGHLRDQDLGELARGYLVGDVWGDNRGQVEGPEDGEAVAEKEG